MRSIRLAVQTTTGLGLGVVVVFMVWRDLENLLSPPVYELTFQFVLLVVAGGAVSWLYRELSRLRDEAARERQAFRELHRELVAAYHAYKKIKRLLRARAWRTGAIEGGETGDLLRVDAYGPLIEELNDVQLRFESMVQRVKGRNELFRRVDRLYGADRAGGLAEDIETVEDYLNNVVQEYERALRPFKEDPAYLRLDTLEAVAEFIAPGKASSGERKEARESFDRAIRNLATVAAETR